MDLRGRALILAFTLSWVVVNASPSAGGQGGGSAVQGWTGSVTVTRQASGSMKAADGASLGFSGSETIVFQLSPDGTAGYQATFRNNWDMAGQYSLPQFGSGSGTTYYGLGFNGVNWEVSIDGGDDFATEVNYTAQDLWWAHQFRGLIELGAAMSGQAPPSSYGGRVEKEARGVNGAAFMSSGGASAKTLSGSHTERMPSSGPEGLDGLPTVPMTVTVSWNLTLGPIEPKVAIRGPECGCLDFEDPESTQLKFRAGATVRGGEFSEFEVIPEGKSPEIVSNEGGERPELVLAGTKETGAVTLKIHYVKNGKRYDPAPMRVEFCTVKKVELDGDATDIAFDGESLEVKGKSEAWHNGEKVSGELAWDLEQMGSPTKLSSEPATAKGEKIVFTYEGLPERNESFGSRKLTAGVNRGKCSCQQRESIRTFFVGEDSTHPGNDDPNWFYYWSQTSAITGPARSALRYQATIVDPNLPDARPIAKYDPETQRLLLSSRLYVPKGCRAAVDRATHASTDKQNEGIDCFAETVRHEWQHRQDAIDWWGSPAGPAGIALPVWFAKDWDHDQVPNEVEDREPHCKYGSHPALTPSGGRETWFTCQGRPYSDTTDAEINAYWVGWTWPSGSANQVDWSCGSLGKQWHGKRCGN